MMKPKRNSLPIRLSFAAASLVLLPAAYLCGQAEPGGSVPETGLAKTPASVAAQVAPKAVAAALAPPAAAPPDRAQAYYHLALANSYEDDAAALGRPELVTQAIEEYKLALNADPGSPS